MFGIHKTRWIRVILAAGILCSAMPGQSWAQKRIFARVEPNVDETSTLRFDVNTDSTDNIAPNIVFSQDNKRGFVGYAGSGTVLAFSLDSGEILAKIKTEGKPSQATLLKDGRSFAIVSVLDDKIFIIDMDSMSLTKTFTFSGAKFGFGSLLTLSPDGNVGYISSTGTGEVIKFSMADGKEMTRLKDLQGPAQITASLDGTIIMVVDVLQEELLFLDENLTKKQALKGKDAPFNFTIFNKAVLSPDGTTGIIGSRDLNGVLGADTVAHFRTSTGELLSTAVVGSEPGFTTLTPNRESWVVFNEFSLTIIDTADFGSHKELSSVQGEPLGSANVVFSPDSRYAIYVSSQSDVVFQHDLVTGAVVGQVLIGDSPNQFLDQPSSVAITPDGRTIAVLDFVSNNLELMTDAWTLEAAKFISSTEKFTGISLVNLADKDTKFTLFALNNFGEIIAGENVLNPSEYTLPPNHQVSLTVAEIFHFDDVEEKTGWIAIITDQPKVAGYVSIGDRALTTLDGAPLFAAPLFDFVVPETIRKEGKFAELDLVNRHFNQENYDLTRYGTDGVVLEERLTNTAFPTNRHAQIFGEIFIDPEESTDGYLRLKSEKGLLHTEYFGSDSAIGALNAISVNSFIGVKTLYSPQFAIFSNYKTLINIINASEEDADITITLRGPDGNAIGQPYRRTLTKNGQLKDDLAFLFREEPAVKDVTGWIQIESTQDRILGTVTFTNPDETFLTSFQLLGSPLDRFLFPLVAQNEFYQTGIALLNHNDEAATITLQLWGTGGSLDRTTTFTLAPKRRMALYLKDYFENLEARLGGHLRVISDKPIHSFSLINDKDFNFITAVPAIPLP